MFDVHKGHPPFYIHTFTRHVCSPADQIFSYLSAPKSQRHKTNLVKSIWRLDPTSSVWGFDDVWRPPVRLIASGRIWVWVLEDRYVQVPINRNIRAPFPDHGPGPLPLSRVHLLSLNFSNSSSWARSRDNARRSRTRTHPQPHPLTNKHLTIAYSPPTKLLHLMHTTKLQNHALSQNNGLDQIRLPRPVPYQWWMIPSIHPSIPSVATRFPRNPGLG